MSITTTAAWRASAQVTKETVALVRLYYGDESNYLTLATGPIEPAALESERYRPLIIDSPVSKSGVDMFTHKFKASDISLRISNEDYHPGVKFSDLISDTSLGAGNDFGFENRRVDIKLWVPGMTAWANLTQFFNGTVRDIKHTDSEVTFSVQDKREIIHKLFDQTLTDADAADTGQGLPEESTGVTKPIIYGDQTFTFANDSKALDTTSVINAMPKIAWTGMDSAGRQRWYVAAHKIDELTSDAVQDQIWAVDTRSGRFVRITNFILEQNTSAGVIVSTLTPPQFLDYWFPKGTVGTTRDVTQGFVTDEENMIDKDFSTFGTIGVAAGGENDGDAEIQIPFPAYDNDIGDATGFGSFFLYGVYQESDANFSLNVGDATGPGDNFAPDAKPVSGSGYPDARLGTDVLFAAADDIFIRIQKDTNDPGESADFDIYMCYKQILYNPGRNLPLRFAGKGHLYNQGSAWITARTQTETHADSGAGEALIENLLGQIESLYRDQLGRVDADFDLASFNVASNDQTNVYAFAITKVEKSLDFIARLAQDGRLFVFLEPTGTIKAKVLEDTYTASDRKISLKTPQSISFSRTKPQRIYTAVKVKHFWDGQKHRSETAVAEDTAMQSKYNVTEDESTLIYNSLAINNDTTAEALRSYLLAQWKQQHNLATLRVGIEHIDLDLGDIVEFDNVQFKPFGLDITQSNTLAGQDILQYWWIYDVQRDITGATIKAFQLHDLS